MDKQIYIHRLQFEKEFSIYNEIWDKIIDLKRSVYTLNMGIVESGDAKPLVDKMLDVMKDVKVKWKTLNDLTEKNKPFYHLSIYNSLRKLNDVALMTAIENEVHYTFGETMNLSPEKSIEHIHKGIKAMDEVEALTNDVCETIRKRIGIISNPKAFPIF